MEWKQFFKNSMATLETGDLDYLYDLCHANFGVNQWRLVFVK